MRWLVARLVAAVGRAWTVGLFGLALVVMQSCGDSPSSPTTVQAEPSNVVLSRMRLLTGGGSFSRQYMLCGDVTPASTATDPIVLRAFDVGLRDRTGREFYSEQFPHEDGLGSGRFGCFGLVHDPDPDRAVAASFRARLSYLQRDRLRTTEVISSDIQPF